MRFARSKFETIKSVSPKFQSLEYQ